MSAQAETTARTEERQGTSGLTSVLVGAVVAFVLSFFLPFVGQVVGGAVSGYLREGSRTTGVKLGAAASGLAAIPGLLVVGLLFGLGILGAFVSGDATSGLVFLILTVLAVVFAVVLAAGLGAVGGYLGAVIAED